MVSLFSFKTTRALFTISVSDEAFKIIPLPHGIPYELRADNDLIGTFKSPYHAVRAVSEHRTGWASWDQSKERVSDFIPKWRCLVDDRFKVQLIANYLESGYDHSYRGLIDYFHRKHSYLLESTEIKRLLEDLAVTGQVKVQLSDHMLPFGFRNVAQMFKRWQVADAG